LMVDTAKFCFEFLRLTQQNFVLKTNRQTDRPTDQPTRLGLDAPSAEHNKNLQVLVLTSGYLNVCHIYICIIRIILLIEVLAANHS
jgi:hypothetical protein